MERTNIFSFLLFIYLYFFWIVCRFIFSFVFTTYKFLAFFKLPAIHKSKYSSTMDTDSVQSLQGNVRHIKYFNRKYKFLNKCTKIWTFYEGMSMWNNRTTKSIRYTNESMTYPRSSSSFTPSIVGLTILISRSIRLTRRTRKLLQLFL